MSQTTQQPMIEMDMQPAEAPQVAQARFSPDFAASLAQAGGGAWMRELSLTLALAAQAGVALDEATLVYSDVRDLMALQRQLRRVAERAAEGVAGR